MSHLTDNFELFASHLFIPIETPLAGKEPVTATATLHPRFPLVYYCVKTCRFSAENISKLILGLQNTLGDSYSKAGLKFGFTKYLQTTGLTRDQPGISLLER